MPTNPKTSEPPAWLYVYQVCTIAKKNNAVTRLQGTSRTAYPHWKQPGLLTPYSRTLTQEIPEPTPFLRFMSPPANPARSMSCGLSFLNVPRFEMNVRPLHTLSYILSVCIEQASDLNHRLQKYHVGLLLESAM